MAALAHKDKDIALIDSNPQMGAKIKISGGGKCNITNTQVSVDNFYGDSDFVKESLETFSRDDLLAFLSLHGLKPVIREGQYYFCQHSAQELIDIFEKELSSTPKYCNQQVTHVTKKEYFELETQGYIFRCKHLIVASGGLSYPRIGASEIGHKVAKTFGHSIVTPKPALVGFTVQKEQFWFKELSGLSTRVAIMIEGKRFEDALLFTHKGLSGPVVLNASLYWDKGSLEVDFVPELSLEKLLKASRKKIPLPKRFLQAFLARYPLEMLKSYTFAPAGNFGYAKAEATRGGVCTQEVDSGSMMSKKEENLYFIGECLDVTGELGGYNFQWAFSSAQNLTLGR